MTVYGGYPGVQVTTAGGGITAIEVGSEEKVVLFGRGGSGSAVVNSPTQIQARREADAAFGEDSELANAMKLALANGANISFLYGVQVEEDGAGENIDTEQDTPTESYSGTTADSLANAPIVEEEGYLAVRDTVDDTDMAVNLVYEETVSAPGDADTINLNPLTGDWTADSSSDYDFFYNYLEWPAAFDAADGVVNEDETGLYVALTESEDVAATLSGKTTELRDEFQLVNGMAGAMPNATEAENPGQPTERSYAGFSTASYEDLIDNDSQFLAAPVRFEDSTETALGAIAGLFGGADISEPIYNDTINTGGQNLEVQFNRTNAQNMRDAEVIPLRQAGAVRVKSNLSTSTETDFERDFWRRRIVDRVILIGKSIGDAIIGRINDEETRAVAERAIRVELQSLANDRLIKDNVDGEQNFFVDVFESSTEPDEVRIDIGVTPVGIVKRVDETITINT
jgi:hypothetical protein